MASRRPIATALVIMAVLAAPGTVPAQEPLSAIDWLSKSVQQPPGLPGPGVPAGQVRAPGPISVAPIGGAGLDGLGLLPVSKTGLPRDLWGLTPTDDLVRLISAERVDTLPVMQRLLTTILLAELSPPMDSDGSGRLFLARVDKLLDMGQLDPVLALLEMPPTLQAEPFRRRFDVALLLGEEDAACELMRANPQIAPTFPARVFCLARGGDWNAAALSLRTGETLGFIEPDMAALLSRFLDPDLYEGEPDLPAPVRPSPLVFRLREAIGQPMSTATLPLAFAQSDLRVNSGWKARLEAAERLARTGAIAPNQLLGLYTERQPAASGGIWDRVRAIQDFDSALAAGDITAVRRTLPVAWSAMQSVELEVPFAELYGEPLSRLNLDGAAGAIALRVGLLAPEYETVAQRRKVVEGGEAFLIGLARGKVAGLPAPGELGAAIQAAFAAEGAPEDAAALMKGRRMGEALLGAIDDVTQGAQGSLPAVTRGLQTLRAAGLEDAARRAALELLLLERRG
ncbi:MAG: hypothetical protein ACOY5U_08775 [Pseudomonadota bacterium]